MPERIQLKRTRGWRKPEGAVVVSRPSRWGNPFRVECIHGAWAVSGDPVEEAFATKVQARERAVSLFRHGLQHGDFWMFGHDFILTPIDVRDELAGKDLACWCPLEDGDGNPAPCHANVLLALANGEAPQ